MIIISPSVLAADFSKLGDEVKKVSDAGAEYIHLDVMDGIFVPNISFGSPVISAIRKSTDAVFDVHLMITDPIRYIDDFAKAGADIITIHYESCPSPTKVVKYIKSLGIKAATAIKPATPVDVLFPMMNDIDMALIMTVEPGFGGQKLIPSTIEKIRELRAYVMNNGLTTDIEVDGGISADNLGTLTEAGANIIVAGSAIFKAEDPASAIKNMRMQEIPYKYTT